MSKWYVTIDKQSSYIDEPDECVWTVSRDPNTTGWCTDSGYSGYGLTKADAEELANAANEIERLLEEIQQLKHDSTIFINERSDAICENFDLREENAELREENAELRETAIAALKEGEKKDDAAT
jgi:hypothetical protein